MGVRLFDPRFKYIPAAATDVAATWRRFGFDPSANEARRAGADFNRAAQDRASKSERKAAASE